MKLNADSAYLIHDHLLTDIARIYSNEIKEPFFVAVGDYAGCDIHSRSGLYRLEVKSETTTVRTGNVALEYWNTDFDKPSGVLGTTANLWLHIVPQGGRLVAYEYDIDRLRKLVIEKGEVKQGGKNALCKIIALDEFKKHARRAFPFEPAFSRN